MNSITERDTNERAKRMYSAFRSFVQPIFETRTRKFALMILVLYLVIAVVGPSLPLPPPYESQQTPSGQFAQLYQPSAAFPLGTTSLGYSVLSQVIHSFRTSIMIGVSAAFVILVLGMNIGLISGYYGGRVDTILMGLTDFVYGLPLYPFALVVIAVIGKGNMKIIMVIGLVLWRTLARVARSETLSIREREFIKASRAGGASDIKIMYSHILPNLLPVLVVYFVFGVAWGVTLEAGLSFLGLGDPSSVSWGIMLHNVFNQAAFAQAWWWVIPPSFALWLFIWSLFVVARALEENTEVRTDPKRG